MLTPIQAEALDLDKTVLQTVVDAATEWKLNDIKGLLGKLYFKGDTIHKKVEFLSGGEKARVALAKFMVTPATVLSERAQKICYLDKRDLPSFDEFAFRPHRAFRFGFMIRGPTN